jgi:hypothetical protein
MNLCMELVLSGKTCKLIWMILLKNKRSEGYPWPGTHGSFAACRKKGNYRDHYVNSMPFTICMATFAVLFAGGLAVGASMLVAGGAKEAQELGPIDPTLKSGVYGEKHAGLSGPFYSRRPAKRYYSYKFDEILDSTDPHST